MHILCIMKVVYRMTVFLATLSIALASVLIILHRLYRRPYRDIVEQCGVEPALIYAIMKAESGFDESAVSKSGAIGLMQLMPSTAEFVGVKYALDRQGRTLYDGRYNVTVGCLYVKYLLERFPMSVRRFVHIMRARGMYLHGCATRRIPMTELPYNPYRTRRRAATKKKFIISRKIIRFCINKA